jgi:hypothetical protein
MSRFDERRKRKNLLLKVSRIKALFDEYEAEQKERFKNFSVGLLMRSKIPQEANVTGAGWVKFVLLTHNELSDLEVYKDDLPDSCLIKDNAASFLSRFRGLPIA